MSKILSNSKLSKRVLSAIYQQKQDEKSKKYIKNYSQLLNRHWSLSKLEQKHVNRKSSLKSYKKPQQKQNSIQKQKPINLSHELDDIQLCQSIQSSRLYNKKSLRERDNPQTQQKMNNILLTKMGQVQKDTFKNITLSQSVFKNTKENYQLTRHIEHLKSQIANQKRKKTKISMNLAKLMNKNQQANFRLVKSHELFNKLQQQNQILQNICHKQSSKNHSLSQIHKQSLARVNLQRQLIECLNSSIQKTKSSLHQQKLHLNEIKSLFSYEQKHCNNIRMDYEIMIQQREKLIRTVHYVN